MALAAVPLLSYLWNHRRKYNYKVIKQRFPDLPDAFDGFTITQISDVHSGSLNLKK
jgi:predicted MPP superfamily phosphohydrolase